MNFSRRVRAEQEQRNQTMTRQHCIDRVCGYLRTLMALEGITDWQACELLGVPVKLLDTAAFRESLKPQDLESVK